MQGMLADWTQPPWHLPFMHGLPHNEPSLGQ